MGILEQMAQEGHEELVICYDRAVGLKAFIGIYDTTLGPALGGTRMWAYAAEEEALTDVLRLSKAMAYKAAAAGLNLGGGKAVVIGDPMRDKSEGLFRALGRYIDSLGGRYISATDVGTTVDDVNIMHQETRWVTGISRELGGSGDTSVLTAVGIFEGLRACAKAAYGNESLVGRKVVVQGVGKVGYHLLEHLSKDGAELVVSDINETYLKRAASEYRVTAVSPEAVYDVECDIFSPNALGAVLNDRTIPRLHCSIIAGGANNQLAENRHGQILHERGILYAPDYVINAGGLINVADELEGYHEARALARVRGIYQTMTRVLATSAERNIPTAIAANQMAEERMHLIGQVHRSYIPRVSNGGQHRPVM